MKNIFELNIFHLSLPKDLYFILEKRTSKIFIIIWLLLYRHRNHTLKIARILVTSFKLHESRSNIVIFIEKQCMHLIQLHGILVRENI